MIPLDVENVAPDVTIINGGGVTAEIDQLLTFSGSFTDPGADSHTIIWDFDDGITTTGSLTVDHAFESAGTFIVTLLVIDDEGGVGSDQTQVVVQSAVIYMPVVYRGGGGSTAATHSSASSSQSSAMHFASGAHYGWHEALVPDGRKLWGELLV